MPNATCQKCHYSCVTCSGISNAQCLTCDTTFRSLVGSTCLCPSGKFDNGINVICENCHTECQACTDRYETTCTQCEPTSMRQIVINPGPCSCMVGYFENNNAFICDVCYYTCLTCSITATNCTSCDQVN